MHRTHGKLRVQMHSQQHWLHAAVHRKQSGSPSNARLQLQQMHKPLIVDTIIPFISSRATLLFKLIVIIIREMGRKVLRKGQIPREQHTQLYDRVTKIETEVLTRIQKLKTMPKSTICPHFSVRQQQEPYNEQQNYYDRYWKQFILNDIGIRQVQKMQAEVREIQHKLSKIEALFVEREEELKPFQSRRSRSSQQEQLSFECKECKKKFKDKETLILHIRIKNCSSLPSQKENIKQEESIQIYQSEEDR